MEVAAWVPAQKYCDQRTETQTTYLLMRAVAQGTSAHIFELFLPSSAWILLSLVFLPCWHGEGGRDTHDGSDKRQ